MPTDDAAAPTRPFPYLDFARDHLAFDPAHHLGLSGVRTPDEATCATLGVPPLPVNAQATAELRAALTARYGVPAEEIHLAAGTSHANFAAYLALARGGRVAVEQPAYQALRAIPALLDIETTRFARDPQRGWALDEASLRTAARGCDLIVVTDLHNPTGRRLDEAAFALLADVAEQEDALVLVDEVYAAFDVPRTHGTARHRGPRFVTTNSLTKVWGLGELRAGWIFAEPEHVERIAALDDLVHPMLPSVCLMAGARALAADEAHLADVRARARAGSDLVDAWVTAHGLSWARPHAGISGLVRIGAGDAGDRLAAHAESAHGVHVVPGSFFEAPEYVRVSFDLPAPQLQAALDVLAQALRELS